MPLLIKLPRSSTAPNEKVRDPIEVRVELADILPTLLQRAGIEIPAQVQGESLLKLMKTGTEGDAAAEAWRDRGARRPVMTKFVIGKNRPPLAHRAQRGRGPIVSFLGRLD